MLHSLTSWEAAKAWLYSQTPSWWGLVMLLFIGHFVKDCIEQFAQSQASYEHDLQLRAKAQSLKQNQYQRAKLALLHTIYQTSANVSLTNSPCTISLRVLFERCVSFHASWQLLLIAQHTSELYHYT